MENKDKIVYWIATGLLSAMMLMSAGMYIFNNAMVSELFKSLGYPVYIIYPFAVAKILGILVILTKKSTFLKELAYAGFFYDFLLAFSAHINAEDGGYVPSIVAMTLLIISYFYDKKVFKTA
ncbi:DoxX family protein [Flavobacterium sp. K5-23]|uniref:DoxX family protein n=1 Tax=Flavobacterium sp. K5-23 TaxID=2746225 RepID=UPI00200BEB55|nr:DoxX family protein [Flavobacterium sp. K5-23]UQD57507.1 DoxX family protein [Flavobacterium sp. K5-23]